MATPSFERGLDMLLDLWVEAALRSLEAERASTGERATAETEIADQQPTMEKNQ
jgi:hypothetical protein